MALALGPTLVLSLFTATTLTLVLVPLLVMAVAIGVPATAFIVFDGELTWPEGVTLYATNATTF